MSGKKAVETSAAMMALALFIVGLAVIIIFFIFASGQSISNSTVVNNTTDITHWLKW